VGALQQSRPAGTPVSSRERPLRIALVGAMVAGVETSFKNVWRVAAAQPNVEPIPVPIHPYRNDGLERLGRVLPSSFRGTIRSMAGTSPLFGADSLQAVWTQVDLPLLPWMLTWNLAHRIPVVYAADSTPRLIRQFGADYNHWGGTSPAKQRMRDYLHGLCLRRCAAVTAWSRWAADSMRDDYGVDPARLHVIRPGVDTSLLAPPTFRTTERRAVRILFVGGDFRRKGGDVLLDVYRQWLSEDAEIDFVTRGDAVSPEPGIRVHSALGPNDPGLIQLYRDADLFVLPTRADCFSVAGMEAMAAGLPVVTCPVGGVGELFRDGIQGFFVPPGDGRALAQAVRTLVSDTGRRLAMGRAARQLAVSDYDTEINTLKLFQLIDSLRAAA